MKDGFHVPVIPFNEVRGKDGAALFRQKGPIDEKVGVTAAELFTVMLIEVVTAHSPASGVNV